MPGLHHGCWECGDKPLVSLILRRESPKACSALCPRAFLCDRAPVTHSGHLLDNTQLLSLLCVTSPFLLLFPRITSQINGP